MTMLRPLLCGAVGAVLILGMHLSDVSGREAALAQFLSSENEGIRRIINDYGVNPDECPAGREDDLNFLAMAFVTVESFATSRSEAWARTLVAYGGALTGFVADISAGPGRIRMSTARAALSGATADRRGPSDLALTEDLLTACGATRIAARILARDRDAGARPATNIDLKFIRTAVRSYNGQAQQASSTQAALSAKIYFDLVYAAYQHYRFAAL